MKILITDRFSIDAFSYLKTQPEFDLRRSESPIPEDKELNDTVGLIIRSRTLIGEEFLSKVPALKVIITATSGFDHIDLNATTKKGVVVMHTPTGNQYSAAELTLGLVLACSRKIVPSLKHMREGNWERVNFLGTELRGKNFGIIGCGRIGSTVSQLLQPFGLSISVFDPYLDPSEFEKLRVKSLGLTELLKSSDFVSLHVPYTKKTHHILNKSTLSEVPSHAIIINTSRGSCINEADLIDALKQGAIAGAGLDVFEHEPLSPDSPLFNLPNVVLTPHVGALTQEAFNRVSWLAAKKMTDFLLRGATSDLLPPQTAWYS